MANVKELLDLEGKVSVVTGGATGIGLRMAPAGALATPDSYLTKYRCGLAGPRMVLLTVSDGSCTDRLFVSVACPTGS